MLVGCGGSQAIKTADGLRCPACETLRVTRIMDGDTLDSLAGRVRLYGVDTLERGEPCFYEATDRLRELAGDMVRVETGPRLTDRYDRLLYDVYTDGGDSKDAALIGEWLGVAWTRDGQHRGARPVSGLGTQGGTLPPPHPGMALTNGVLY